MKTNFARPFIGSALAVAAVAGAGIMSAPAAQAATYGCAGAGTAPAYCLYRNERPPAGWNYNMKFYASGFYSSAAPKYQAVDLETNQYGQGESITVGRDKLSSIVNNSGIRLCVYNYRPNNAGPYLLFQVNPYQDIAQLASRGADNMADYIKAIPGGGKCPST